MGKLLLFGLLMVGRVAFTQDISGTWNGGVKGKSSIVMKLVNKGDRYEGTHENWQGNCYWLNSVVISKQNLNFIISGGKVLKENCSTPLCYGYTTLTYSSDSENEYLKGYLDITTKSWECMSVYGKNYVEYYRKRSNAITDYEQPTAKTIVPLAPSITYTKEVEVSVHRNEDKKVRAIEPNCMDVGDFQINMVKETSAHVEFAGDLSIFGALFYYRPINTTKWVYVSIKKEYLNLMDLQEETEYECFVRSECEGGNLKNSEKNYFKTKGKEPSVKEGVKAINKESIEKIIERKITDISQSVLVRSKEVIVKLWDHRQIDGDIISLYLNENMILENYTLTKNAKEIKIVLNEGENRLVLVAKNLGSNPPNTAAIQLDADGILKTIELKADLKTSEAWVIRR